VLVHAFRALTLAVAFSTMNACTSTYSSLQLLSVEVISRHCVKETKQVGWFLKLPSSPAGLMQHRVKNFSHSCSGCRIYACRFECRLLGNLSVPLSTKCSEMALTCGTFKMSIHIHVGICRALQCIVVEVSHDHLHNHTAWVHLEIDPMGGKMSILEKEEGQALCVCAILREFAVNRELEAIVAIH